MPDSFILPPHAPVMTLPGVVLFPRSMLPLHIFEARYREMLRDTLGGSRLFCVAALNESEAAFSGTFEPAFPIATAGIIRASHQHPDGTSNLMIQGLIRVRLVSILREDPYRVAAIEGLPSAPGAKLSTLAEDRKRLLRQLQLHRRLGGEIPNEVLAFFSQVEDPDALVDLTAHACCNDADQRQLLLETLDTHLRFQRCLRHIRSRNQALRLEIQLRGALGEDNIGSN